jgi:hypothetical protein
MSSSKFTSTAFIGLTTLTIIGSAAGLALIWPHAVSAAKHKSAVLVGEAAAANAPEAAADYQLAAWLDSSNAAAWLGLARTKLAAGQPAGALQALEQAGQGSEAGILRIKTLMELGRTSEAADRAVALTGPGHSPVEITLAALAYAQAGRQSEIPALIPLVAAPEALQRIARVQAGELPLASELYASGLPESSRTLLLKLRPSFERNLLLGRIYAARHTPAGLASATGYLASAAVMNPADVATHRLLAQVYAERNLAAESSKQSALARKLQAGRP